MTLALFSVTLNLLLVGVFLAAGCVGYSMDRPGGHGLMWKGLAASLALGLGLIAFVVSFGGAVLP